LPGDIPAAGRTGRNLPAALGVGLLLGGLALLTLFTVKATFLLYMGVVAGSGLWEFSRTLGVRGLRVALVPVVLGGIAAWTLAYWYGERALAPVAAVTVIVILAWRLTGGTDGYLRDVSASVFAFAYVPVLAAFVPLMLAAGNGAERTLTWVIVTICSDIGGYFTGILIGRHPMVPRISPKKTWEGFVGSVLACLGAGAATMAWLLHGPVWKGLLVGAAVVVAATLGDLASSMIKRDLEIKDWGTLLPGHGGVLDRIDSLLITAPVAWLLLWSLLPLAGHH
jgi:phosphatidate cytidylyltransferase